MTMIKNLSCLFLLMAYATANAQDIRGGEISVQAISGLSYSFDILLYTRTSSGINHDSVIFNPGDGSRISLSGVPSVLSNDVTRWQYNAIHTYPSAGSYTATVVDSFRLGGLLNMTNSSSEEIRLEQFLVISPSLGTNSSPNFLNSQLDSYTDGQFYYHQPAGFDIDGDSLVYNLVPASTGVYLLPTGSVDPISGLVKINAQPGLILVNIQVDEYRQGNIIGTTHREMLFDSQELGLSLMQHPSHAYRLYPNPACSALYIELETGTNKYLHYSILDQQGSIVVRNQPLNDERSLDISRLPEGPYLLLIQDGPLVMSKPFIKKS